MTLEGTPASTLKPAAGAPISQVAMQQQSARGNISIARNCPRIHPSLDEEQPVISVPSVHIGRTPSQIEHGVHPNTAEAERIAQLNTLQNVLALRGPYRPIPKQSLKELHSINDTLKQISGYAERIQAAEQYPGQVYQLLGLDPKEVEEELKREPVYLQFAAFLNEVLNFAPTVVGATVVGGVKVGAGVMGWSTFMLLGGPWISVMLFNAAYFGFDFTREVGQPGRMTQIERAPHFQKTLEDMRDNCQALESALMAFNAAQRGGVALSPEEARASLVSAREAAFMSRESRNLSKAYSDSFEWGRMGQTIIGAVKQTLLYLAQYVSYAQSKDCKGGSYAFYMIASTIALTRLLAWSMVSRSDRAREGNMITAANMAYGRIDRKSDARDLFRPADTQKSWRLNDGIEKRSLAIYQKLAKQYKGFSAQQIKLLDEKGAFNHVKFSVAMDASELADVTEFRGSCEGPALGACQGVYQELGALVVLEGLAMLHTLEQVEKLGVLNALDKGDASRSVAEPRFIPSKSEVRRVLGLESDQAAQDLVDGPLPRAWARDLAELKRYEEISPEQLARLRIILGFENLDEVENLLAGPPADAKSALPSAISAKLVALKANYEKDETFEQIRQALSLNSIASAKALCKSPLRASWADQLTQLQKKYETRELLQPDDYKEVTRDELLRRANQARADGTVLTPLELAVRDRLLAKARTSTINIHTWRAPYDSGAPEEDQERRDHSLTPFEHLVLETLQVRPSVDRAASSSAGQLISDHDLANESLKVAPTSFAEVRSLLLQLREHRLDARVKAWDLTKMTDESMKEISDVFLEGKGWAGNTWEAIKTRFNMPGYIVPAIVVQAGRGTFMGVGGTYFFFFTQAAAGLIRQARPETFVCTPGEGLNRNSELLSYSLMGAGTLAYGFAMLGVWGGGAAYPEFASETRGAFFRSPAGRPTFPQFFGRNYLYSARRAVTDPLFQRFPLIGTGRRTETRLSYGIARAGAVLEGTNFGEVSVSTLTRAVDVDPANRDRRMGSVRREDPDAESMQSGDRITGIE